MGNLWSLNFVIEGLLEGLGCLRTRPDGQAKSLGEWLRARVVDLPTSLVQVASAEQNAQYSGETGR